MWERPRGFRYLDGEAVTGGRSIPNIARRTGPWSTLEVARGVDLLRETELRFGVWREVESLVCATKEHRLERGVFMS